MSPTVYLALILAVILASKGQSAVLDTDGNVLLPRVGYYILPVFRGYGGGLTLAGRGSEICPLDIVQAQSELDNGIPVKFSNWRPRVGFVLESQDLNIKTDVAATICIQSTFWWIDNFDDERKQWFVTAGPKPSGFGQESFKSFFKIEKSRQDYKFVFCPQGCETCKPICSDVGLFIDENGVRRLALSDVPFEVMFKKANESESSTMSM